QPPPEINFLELTSFEKMTNIMVMQAPIAQVKRELCELVDRVEKGETVTILRHGRPVARLLPMPGCGKPWRVAKPDDPRLYIGRRRATGRPCLRIVTVSPFST